MLRYYFILLAVLSLGGVAVSAIPKNEPLPGHDGDTLRNTYVNGAISVAISPWADGERNIQLYDLSGRITFTFRQSESSDATLSYYPNGAVKLIEVKHVTDSFSLEQHSKITFCSTNDPQWKMETTQDCSGTAVGERKKYYWHMHDHKWVRQETITCQPHPGQQEK